MQQQPTHRKNIECPYWDPEKPYALLVKNSELSYKELSKNMSTILSGAQSCLEVIVPNGTI